MSHHRSVFERGNFGIHPRYKLMVSKRIYILYIYKGANKKMGETVRPNEILPIGQKKCRKTELP